MTYAPRLAALDAYLATVPSTVSVWCAAVGSTTPAYARLADTPHYACSTMKVAVLAALHRAGGAGILDLDARVPVVNDFASAKPGAPRFVLDPGYDQDVEVWAQLGQTATLRWLARRMIVRSSNLASNLVLSYVGLPAVADVLRIAGAAASRIERGIADTAAREAGFANVITARDLGVLLATIALDAEPARHSRGDGRRLERLATPSACTEMLDVLLAQERREDLAAGLPPGTRVAHKNGWIDGVRHAAGVVFPDDAPPYAISVCTTASSVDRDVRADARTLIARVAAASWADRHAIAMGPAPMN